MIGLPALPRNTWLLWLGWWKSIRKPHRRLQANTESILRLIEDFPRAFPTARVPHTGEVRHAVLRYRYLLIYEVRDSAVEVLAFWHGRQDPSGWKTH